MARCGTTEGRRLPRRAGARESLLWKQLRGIRDEIEPKQLLTKRRTVSPLARSIHSLALDVYIRFPSRRFPPGKLVCVTQYTGCGEKYPSEICWQCFPQRVRIFSKRNFTRLHVCAKLLNFIQLSLTLTKLCHIKRDRLVNFYISPEKREKCDVCNSLTELHKISRQNAERVSDVVHC